MAEFIPPIQDTLESWVTASFGSKKHEVLKWLQNNWGLTPGTILPELVWLAWEDVLHQNSF